MSSLYGTFADRLCQVIYERALNPIITEKNDLRVKVFSKGADKDTRKIVKLIEMEIME
jgi:hypothetical protein